MGPTYGQIKAGNGPAINGKAKRLVRDALRKYGLIAKPAANSGLIRVVGHDSVTIRVKAMTSASKGWRWNVKNRTVFRDIGLHDFCVLVDLNDDRPPAQYYIVPTRDVEAKLQEAFQKWLAGKPGRSESNSVWFLGDHPDQCEWLQGYRDWKLLLSFLPPPRRK